LLLLQGTSNHRAAASKHSTDGSDDLYCSTCNIRLQDINTMRTHLQSSRHRVTMLAQQLRASGSMHANQQGICVSEVPEGLVTR
jgi:hypothetical protein